MIAGHFLICADTSKEYEKYKSKLKSLLSNNHLGWKEPLEII